MFKIDKGVPMPGKRHNMTQYPFAEMKVGDSFVIPYGKRQGCMASAHTWGERQDPAIDFASRTIDGNKVRVWRVE